MTVVFDITHSGNDLSEYDSTVTDGGSLSTSANAALASTNYGLDCALAGGTEIYGTKDATKKESFSFRGYLDPNNITMANNDSFNHIRLRQNSSLLRIFVVTMRYTTADGYRIGFQPFDDSGSITVDIFDISDAPHFYEFQITRSSGVSANDGSIEFFLDGVSKGTVSSVDNFNIMGDEDWEYMIGAPVSLDTGTSGTFYCDEFTMNDDGSYIGPVVTVHDLTATDITTPAPVLDAPTLTSGIDGVGSAEVIYADIIHTIKPQPVQEKTPDSILTINVP